MDHEPRAPNCSVEAGFIVGSLLPRRRGGTPCVCRSRPSIHPIPSHPIPSIQPVKRNGGGSHWFLRHSHEPPVLGDSLVLCHLGK